MLSALARALETVLGPALVPAASAFRVAAVLALLAAILVAGAALTRAIAGWRYGWVPAVVVRCPRCGTVAADPGHPACPEGHPVRFPSSTVRRIGVPSTRGRRFVQGLYPAALAAGVCVAAVAAYRAADLDSLSRPISTMTASLAYLFFTGSLAAAAYALSPRPVGLVSRLLHAGLAVACVLPALTLAWLARGFEPPVEREIGSLWTTPAALYVSSGSRARREGAAAERLDAWTVDARLPGFGVFWEGLEGFHAGGREIPWRGRGGVAARFAARWFRPSRSADSLFVHTVQPVALRPNQRVRILATREHVRFAAEP